MTESQNASTTDALIEYRKDIADLQQRIKNRRFQVFGLYSTPIAALLTILVWRGAKIVFWLDVAIPTAINGTFVGIVVFLCAVTVVQFGAEFLEGGFWEDSGTSLRSLKFKLELTEEQRILEARRLTPPTVERQASYKERIPGEIARLRKESRHYRRVHLLMQWMLFFSSAAITGVTAWYDPPQPGKGALIGLGFTVSVVTAAAGYFKPRERAFNLQQTADSMEQHATALELGIMPYAEGEESARLKDFATTVERLRADQRMREQQLDQPQQGQQEVI
ncbi:SLATT domain-containing protein [Streptomyces roseoverticillatus]|uniref:SLATT domain-containing protein n=1 Tax=Streptomyces roseoverticillatus TaxID=66429 RepID=UPI001F2B90AA|nr:SLATT domain-containing protein [Streptomyces roseoverticillatus]MCF3102926.1 SLATT domain-containing protein [Streptomyces roseoverticillatus]